MSQADLNTLNRKLQDLSLKKDQIVNKLNKDFIEQITQVVLPESAVIKINYYTDREPDWDKPDIRIVIDNILICSPYTPDPDSKVSLPKDGLYLEVAKKMHKIIDEGGIIWTYLEAFRARVSDEDYNLYWSLSWA